MWAGPGAGTSDGWRQGVTPGYTGRPNIEVAHCTVQLYTSSMLMKTHFHGEMYSSMFRVRMHIMFRNTDTLNRGRGRCWCSNSIWWSEMRERGMLNSFLHCHILVFTADGLIHSNSRSCRQGGRGWYIGAKSGGDPALPEYEAGPGKNLEGEGMPSNMETWEMWQLWGNWKFCRFISSCLLMARRTRDNTHKCRNPWILLLFFNI